MGKKKQSVVSFSAKGWGVIIFSIIMFFFYASMNADGMNILAAAYSGTLAVEQGTVFTMVGIGGLLGVVVHIILGQVIRRVGPKKSLLIAMILAAVGMFIEAHAPNLGLFLLGRTLLSGATLNAAFMGCGVLCANWFPKRKGIVMGYTTWGLNICSLCGVAILSGLVAALGGIGNASIIYILAYIIMGIVAIIALKDDPLKAGQYPDNVSKEEYETEYNTSSLEEGKSHWTTVKLLKTPYLWLVGILSGACNIGTGVLVSNMVGRNMEMGMTEGQAILTMSIVAAIGIVGSWVVGVIDEKVGTKKALIGFCVWYFIATLFNFAASFVTGGASTACLYISIVMIGVGIGGSANFTTSLPASVFGRHGFDTVNSVIFPIQAVMIALNFVISGIIRTITGNDLKFIFLASGIVWVILLFATFLIRDEYKFNLDKKAELAAKGSNK